MLHFGVVFLEEEVVGKVIEDHRVRRVDLVCFGQFLHGGTDSVGSFQVHLQDCETHQSTNATDKAWMGVRVTEVSKRKGTA